MTIIIPKASIVSEMVPRNDRSMAPLMAMNKIKNILRNDLQIKKWQSFCLS